MNDPDDSPDALRDELRTLTAALGAHLELFEQAGTLGLPRGALSHADDPGAVQVPAPARTPASAPFRQQQPPPARRPPAAPMGEAARDPGMPTVAAPPAPTRAEPPGDEAAARARLAVLQQEVAACTRCGLHRERQQTVFSRGTGSSGLCFVGEGPGMDEDAQGLPFVGKAGQLLDRMIAAMGLERDEVYVCNIVKCRPPGNRKPEPEEMAACRPYVVEQLELVRPQVIVALGATAIEGLLGISGIMRLRGKWRLYQGRIPVMPTFHPAYLLRTPAAKRDVWKDLQEVLRHMGRPVPARTSHGA